MEIIVTLAYFFLAYAVYCFSGSIWTSIKWVELKLHPTLAITLDKHGIYRSNAYGGERLPYDSMEKVLLFHTKRGKLKRIELISRSKKMIVLDIFERMEEMAHLLQQKRGYPFLEKSPDVLESAMPSFQ